MVCRAEKAGSEVGMLGEARRGEHQSREESKEDNWEWGDVGNWTDVIVFSGSCIYWVCQKVCLVFFCKIKDFFFHP